MNVDKIQDKEYFAYVATKYLKSIPSNILIDDAKNNIRENISKITTYSLLKEIIVHQNPVETIETGFTILLNGLIINEKTTVADILSQLKYKNSNA